MRTAQKTFSTSFIQNQYFKSKAELCSEIATKHVTTTKAPGRIFEC
jgi:hypothetical protein